VCVGTTMRHSPATLCSGLLAAGLWVAAATVPAFAEDRARAAPPAFFKTEIGFEVAGTITARCTIDQDGHEAGFGDLLDTRRGGNRDAELDLAFRLDCNSPFRVAMTSQNGGLVTPTLGGGAFRDTIDYSAALTLADGRQTAACDSRDMERGGERDGRCVFRFRDRQGASGTATINLSVTADAAPLRAGSYSDRLMVRITPLMGGDD
jgi:hypothetical protein